MSGRTAATHLDADSAKLIAHCGRREAQLGTDLAQGPTLGVQVGCTLNVHRDTVTSLSRIGRSERLVSGHGLRGSPRALPGDGEQ
jgi:hypothetical protein